MSGGRQMIALDAQVAEAKTAFRMRETDIIQQVQRGRMRESVGEMHVARLRAALRTLEWVAKHETAIKARVNGAAGGNS